MSDYCHYCNMPNGTHDHRCPELNANEQSSLAATAGSAASWESLDWPNPKARFEIYDDGDPHGQLAIILPGGQLMNCGGHADLATDLRRAKWICDALNKALEQEMQPNDQAQRLCD